MKDLAASEEALPLVSIVAEGKDLSNEYVRLLVLIRRQESMLVIRIACQLNNVNLVGNELTLGFVQVAVTAMTLAKLALKCAAHYSKYQQPLHSLAASGGIW